MLPGRGTSWEWSQAGGRGRRSGRSRGGGVDAVHVVLRAVAAGAAGAHPCPNCSAAYSLKRNLQRHLRLECGQEPRFQCPVCDYRSKRRNNLHNHVLLRHPDTPLPAM
ncbi:hypothetical protein FOCC_FOCC005474 [Frankliniella occidentalis]|nr:hypothetical protein FOCC_FOCC005474 [Frankliniella occidentalis]